MNKLILTTAALALTAGISFADTVRMGTEGAYPPITSSMTPAKSMALSANWAMSFAFAPH